MKLPVSFEQIVFRMSKIDELFNFEAGKNTKIQLKYVSDRNNAFYAMLTRSKRKRKCCDDKLIRVYSAGKMDCGNSQLGPFNEAIKHLRDEGYRIEYLHAMDIKEKYIEWDHPSCLVDWLLDSDFYFILCQGIHNQMFGIWRPQDCIEEIKRLEYHAGFPSGIQLRDPVFNGDKFEYLSAASQFCNPSFKIPLNMGHTFLDEVLERAKLFLEDFKAYEGDKQDGFVMKAPFVQNKQGFNLFYFKTYDQLVSKIRSCFVKGDAAASRAIGKLHVMFADVFPYLIVQPRMINNFESKVILWNGKSQYLNINTKRGIVGSNKNGSREVTIDEVFKFAEEAWEALRKGTGGAFLGDGLSRVDCFLTAGGKLVVNEFESLDANFSGPKLYECRTPTFLCDYYKNIITKSKL